MYISTKKEEFLIHLFKLELNEWEKINYQIKLKFFTAHGIMVDGTEWRSK